MKKTMVTLRDNLEDSCKTEHNQNTSWYGWASLLTDQLDTLPWMDGDIYLKSRISLSSRKK